MELPLIRHPGVALRLLLSCLTPRCFVVKTNLSYLVATRQSWMVALGRLPNCGPHIHFKQQGNWKISGQGFVKWFTVLVTMEILHADGVFFSVTREQLFSSRAKTWSHYSFYYLGKILIKALRDWLKAQYFKGVILCLEQKIEDKSLQTSKHLFRLLQTQKVHCNGKGESGFSHNSHTYCLPRDECMGSSWRSYCQSSTKIFHSLEAVYRFHTGLRVPQRETEGAEN